MRELQWAVKEDGKDEWASGRVREMGGSMAAGPQGSAPSVEEAIRSGTMGGSMAAGPQDPAPSVEE